VQRLRYSYALLQILGLFALSEVAMNFVLSFRLLNLKENTHITGAF
jgi:hypothetical protein